MDFLQVDIVDAEQRRELLRVALQRNWGACFVLVGWLHLLAFGYCQHLESIHYHVPPVFLSVWVAEMLASWAVFRIVAGRRTTAAGVLERFVRRVWIAYFILAFNLGSMHTLRGFVPFELFPAMASLASFAFMMMTVVVSWRYVTAVIVMFSTGLVMAANFEHAYAIFAIGWWLVLNGLGLSLWRRRQAVSS
jgi:hypothetical protein